VGNLLQKMYMSGKQLGEKTIAGVPARTKKAADSILCPPQRHQSADAHSRFSFP